MNKETAVGCEVLSAFQSKIEAKTAQVGIIGLGYVGLPLALLFARDGFTVSGFDLDPNKVTMLAAGRELHSPYPATVIAEHVEQKRFKATTDFSHLRDMDAILICVPTPLDAHREPDLSFVRDTAEAIAPHLRRGQLVVLESTTYPGTTEEVVLPILEKSGLRCPVSPYATDGREVTAGEEREADFLLAFSPEREDPGNKQFQTQQVPKVVGGSQRLQCAGGAGALCAGFRKNPSGQFHARCGDDQDSGEHLSLRQHRARQRTEAALPADGYRHLGSDRGRQDQALWLHRLLSGSGLGRPLHSH